MSMLFASIIQHCKQSFPAWQKPVPGYQIHWYLNTAHVFLSCRDFLLVTEKSGDMITEIGCKDALQSV